MMTGKQLKRMVERAGKTQVGLARELKIGERTMRKYIASDRHIPRVVELAVRYVCEPIIASSAPSEIELPQAAAPAVARTEPRLP